MEVNVSVISIRRVNTTDISFKTFIIINNPFLTILSWDCHLHWAFLSMHLLVPEARARVVQREDNIITTIYAPVTDDELVPKFE